MLNVSSEHSFKKNKLYGRITREFVKCKIFRVLFVYELELFFQTCFSTRLKVVLSLISLYKLIMEACALKNLCYFTEIDVSMKALKILGRGLRRN